MAVVLTLSLDDDTLTVTQDMAGGQFSISGTSKKRSIRTDAGSF